MTPGVTHVMTRCATIEIHYEDHDRGRDRRVDCPGLDLAVIGCDIGGRLARLHPAMMDYARIIDSAEAQLRRSQILLEMAIGAFRDANTTLEAVRIDQDRPATAGPVRSVTAGRRINGGRAKEQDNKPSCR
jgi:hypothetical protein